MKRLAAFLITAILICPLLTPALAIPDMHVAAKSAFLIEVNSGEILYAQDAEVRVFPASITKIMTVLLVLENGNPDDIVTASASAVQGLHPDSSTSGIVAGEEMTVLDLLYCIMLQSANEGCNVAAEYISGDIEAFIDLMNKRAAELGATDTHFVNTHGLHDEEHYTTSRDVALITLEAIKHPEFLEICNTAKKEIPATNKSPERYLLTTNHLISTLKEPGYIYHPAKGIKTGHTTPAGNCLVSIAEKNGLTLVSVVMGAETVKNDAGKNIVESFTETVKLFEWGFDNFTEKVIIKSGEPVAETKVELGLDADHVTLRPEKTISSIVPKDLDIDGLWREITIFDEGGLVAPIEKDQVLGKIVISQDGKEYANLNLLAVKGVERSNLLYMFDRAKTTISQPWVKITAVSVVVLVVGYTAFMIRYNAKRREKSRNYRGKRRKK